MKKIFSVISVVLIVCLLICSFPVSARSGEFISFTVQTVSVTNLVDNIEEIGYVYDDTLFVPADFLCKYTMYYYDFDTTSFVRSGHLAKSLYGRVKLDITNKTATLYMNPFSKQNYTLKNIFVFGDQVFLPLDQMAALLKASIVAEDNVVRIITSGYSLADAEYAIETIAMNDDYIAYDYAEILDDIYCGQEHLMEFGGILSYFSSTIFDKRISNLAFWGDNEYSYYESFLTKCVTDNESYINALANSDDLIARLARASGATEAIKNGAGKIKDITTMLADLAEPMKDYSANSFDVYVNCSGVSEALKPLLKLAGYADYFLKTSSMLEDHQKMLEGYIGRIGSSELAKDKFLNTSGSAYLAALISVYEKYGQDFVENTYAKLGEDFAKDLTEDIIKEAIKSKSEIALSTLLKASMVISFVNTMFELMGFDLSTNSEFSILTSVSVKSDLFNDLISLPENHYTTKYSSERYRLAAIFLLLACKQVFKEANALSAKYEGSETLYNNRIENVDTILGLFYQAAESKNYDNFKSVNDLIESNKKILVDSGIAKNAPTVSQEEDLSNEEVSNNITKTITQKDIDSLENILNRYHFISEYDYSKMNMEKLIDGYISSGCSLPAHEEYFDSSRRSRSNIYQTPDPQGLIFTDFYYTVAESDIKWLAENVFNVSYKQVSNKKQVTLTSVAGIHSTNGFLSYYDSGMYYLSAQNCQSTLAQDFVVKSYSLINGGKYRILVDYYENFFDEPKAYVTTLEIVAEVRVTDKIRHWSFYTIKVASEGTNKNTASDWVSAYREFLRAYVSDQYMSFSLCYINDDEIPELVVGKTPEYAGHSEMVNVYTYYNGKVSLLCKEIGMYGNVFYLKRGNLICSWYGSMGRDTYSVYEIDNGSASQVWQGFYYEGTATIEPEWKSNGEAVDEGKFTEMYNKYFPYEELSPSNESSYVITDDNINAYVTE